MGNDFNPRSLAGATAGMIGFAVRQLISIHAPSRERLSTNTGTAAHVDISIHAPSRERRLIQLSFIKLFSNFNPRSLAGATRIHFKLNLTSSNFNPRSLAGATTIFLNEVINYVISIHAPSRERPYLV